MHLVGFIVRIYHDARSPERPVTLPRKIGIRLPTDAVSQQRTTESSSVPLRKPQNSQDHDFRCAHRQPASTEQRPTHT